MVRSEIATVQNWGRKYTFKWSHDILTYASERKFSVVWMVSTMIGVLVNKCKTILPKYRIINVQIVCRSRDTQHQHVEVYRRYRLFIIGFYFVSDPSNIYKKDFCTECSLLFDMVNLILLSAWQLSRLFPFDGIAIVAHAKHFFVRPPSVRINSGLLAHDLWRQRNN